MAPSETIAGGKTQSQQPLSDMASSFINTIGFVPRAIGSAVADTFRSRSQASIGPNSTCVDGRRGSSSAATTTPSSDQRRISSAASLVVHNVSAEVKSLRKKIYNCSSKDLEHSVSVAELSMLLADYKVLLEHMPI